MREITLSEIERSEAAVDAASETFHMDEESFRAFYAKTARSLWSYLSRISGDAALADDLLQESYFRFLRAKLPEMGETHLKNYLFRIATNLLRDHWRRQKGELVPMPEMTTDEHTARKVQLRSDLARLLRHLKPRERELLWLAYVEGSSHKEIADMIGLKVESIRLLLFRARRKLADVLRERGFGAGILGR